LSKVFVRGAGAVSPAGWGVPALREALTQTTPLPFRELPCPCHTKPLKGLGVPPASPKPAFTGHPRLRRTSPIGQYMVAAALEALGTDAINPSNRSQRLGIVYCAMSGCVNFSRRFYDETLKDPATASPVIFPETVFNAPASHLGALLGTTAINYTLVGDPGTFLLGLALAADWLASGSVDGCLVIGAEELDWLVAEAFDLFDPDGTVSEGAGALYLCRDSRAAGSIELRAITHPHLFSSKQNRARAARLARSEIGPGPANSLLCDGVQGVRRLDQDEDAAWSDWRGARLSPKRKCGEGFMAAAAWQCVAAVDALWHGAYDTADVSVVGCNQQAIAARFSRSTEP
jgi:hypothetical protein